MTPTTRTAVVLGTNLIVGAGALGVILVSYGGPASTLLASRVAPGALAAFGGSMALAFLGYAFRWRIVLGGLGVRPSLWRLTTHRAAGQSLSNLVPSARLGGEPLRVFLLAWDRIPGPTAVASVAVDRVLDMGASMPFVLLYAVLLLRRGVPELQGAFVTVTAGALFLVGGIGWTVRRLRRGEGLVTAMARSLGLERFGLVARRMDVLAAAERAAAALVAQPRRLARAFAVGLAVNVVVLVEYHLLLRAFGLPAGPTAVVAAIFATGAAHSLPVPAAVGTLEGAQLWLFGILGHPPEVGLAVGLAVRLREILWVVPGLVVLGVRGLALRRVGARRRPPPETRERAPAA